jgi:CRP-like cAMP-binding protein
MCSPDHSAPQVRSLAARSISRLGTNHAESLAAILEDLERIATLLTERRYDTGELIFAWGAEGDEMLIIVEGEVTVSRPQQGSGGLIRTVRSGDYVGELSLLRGQPRVADVTAGPEGVRGLILRGAELHAILEERPEAAMAMLATLAERLGADWNR